MAECVLFLPGHPLHPQAVENTYHVGVTEIKAGHLHSSATGTRHGASSSRKSMSGGLAACIFTQPAAP